MKWSRERARRLEWTTDESQVRLIDHRLRWESSAGRERRRVKAQTWAFGRRARVRRAARHRWSTKHLGRPGKKLSPQLTAACGASASGKCGNRLPKRIWGRVRCWPTLRSWRTRKTAILDAVIVRSGVRGLRVEDVAGTAGVAVSLLYTTLIRATGLCVRRSITPLVARRIGDGQSDGSVRSGCDRWACAEALTSLVDGLSARWLAPSDVEAGGRAAEPADPRPERASQTHMARHPARRPGGRGSSRAHVRLGPVLRRFEV
jgi:hypothetical protein